MNSLDIRYISSEFSVVEREVRLLSEDQGDIQLRQSVVLFVEAILDLF